MLDLGILLISFIMAYYIVTGSFLYLTRDDLYLILSLMVVWAFTGNANHLYDEFRSRDFSYELVLVVKNIAYSIVAVIIFLFLLKITNYPRLFIIYYSGIFLLLTFTEKIAVRRFFNYMRKRGRNLRTMLIIGAGRNGRNFHKSVVTNPHFGYKIIGFLDDRIPSDMNGEYLGAITELDSILNKKNIDNVIVALPTSAHKQIENVISICEKYTTRIKIIPDYFRFNNERYSVSMVGDFPLISVSNERINEIQCVVIKRLFDILFSVLIIIFVMPWLTAIVYLVHKVLDQGPVIYKGIRWGRGGNPFVCYKFRSMKVFKSNSRLNGEHQYTRKNDERITKFGKFLRRTNLDEFPQFINVFLGDMSIVGPRPHDEKENLEIKDQINSYMWRHLVKPGITGWAQVHGYRGGTNDMSLMKKRTQYDLWYIENWSFLLDIQIIFLTIWRMIKGDPNAY